MPKKLPTNRQLTLEDEAKLRALRRSGRSIYGRTHRVTGAFSIWVNVPRAEGKRWRMGILIKALPPRTPRNTIERWCEALGCPPPWIPRVDRKEWRADWRKRNGIPERKPRLERERERRVVSIGSLGKSIEDIPDDRDLYDDDEDFDEDDE